MRATSETAAGVLGRIRAAVGPKGWISDSEDMAPYLTDQRGRYHGRCDAVVRPANREEVAEVVRLSAEARIPIVPQGGNTGLVGASVPLEEGGGIVLSLSRMNRIREIDPLNDTMTAEAGCVLADLQAAAKDVDRLFPLSLAAEGSCMIGGNLSTNAGGNNAVRFGTAREQVLGLEVVLPDGSIWDGLRRLRLFYLYPKEIRPALLEEMSSNDRIADYFDLSLQHSSARLLRAMKRPGSGDHHRDLIESIRDAAPDAALRSSFIVGFPGETEDDVDDLASFLGDVRLDWAGFFPYSPEEGTPAATMSDQLPEEVKAERLRYLQALQDDITTEATIAQVGRTLTVVVDQVEAGQPVARSYREAPEIDGVVLLDRGEPGEWLTVEITGGYGTDVNAIVVGPA